MMLALILLSVCLTFRSVLATDFEPCMNATQPLALRVAGCDHTPCRFPVGETAIFEVDFGVDHDVTELEAKAVARAFGIDMTYPLPQPNVCLALTNGECPLDAGEEVTYRMEMPLLRSFPKIRAMIRFYLRSEHGIETCLRISGVIV
uniref:Unkown protein n=1 Tax=Riptortus pedestris TaxID=329032 RepID=R4WNC6_RIPPE|nr:unkown protein [Riptortus pedestris]